MRHTYLLRILLLLNLTLASCASIVDNKAAVSTPNKAPKAAIVRDTSAADPAETKQLTIGEAEYLYIVEADYAYDSRIDTGATTCSIHAEDITEIERDGEKWVKFKLVNFDTKKRIERSEKVMRVVEIKQHGSDPVTRYAVNLKVKIGDDTRTFEFTLTDRSKYTYPLLVGRNLLRGIAVVDVSQIYTLPKSTK